jgi:hypothetical protein
MCREEIQLHRTAHRIDGTSGIDRSERINYGKRLTLAKKL